MIGSVTRGRAVSPLFVVATAVGAVMIVHWHQSVVHLFGVSFCWCCVFGGDGDAINDNTNTDIQHQNDDDRFFEDEQGWPGLLYAGISQPAPDRLGLPGARETILGGILTRDDERSKRTGDTGKQCFLVHIVVVPTIS